MSSTPKQPVRPFRTLAILVLVLWGLYAWWALGRVQSTGQLLRDSLRADWPAEKVPAMGTRDKLAATANELASGQPWHLGDTLAPVEPPNPDERAAASKFLKKHPELRSRLLSLTDAARDLATDGDDVAPVRETLARAYRGAIQADRNTVDAQLNLAERILASVESGASPSSGPIDEQAVKQLAKAIDPAYQLSQDLMTEGGAAAEKVLVVAARELTEKRYAQAATAIRLAGELLGAQLILSAKPEMPEWFVVLAERDIPEAKQQQALAAVELAEAMSLSVTPSDTVVALLRKARRELDSGRFDTAAWWAGVTLNALGMSDAAIAAATTSSEEPAEGPADEEDAE
jgi:hypothetical protein